jgi:FkbM family methyltransferase
MYHRFKWTRSSRRRNDMTIEYEPLQPYFLLAIITTADCRTFVDVGSNVGAYSVLMSQAPSVEKIVAFEANRSAALEMRENFRLNSLNIEIKTVAVSDRVGSLTFGTVSRLAGNSAVVDTSENREFHHVDQVECVTLDSALADYPGPFALKIDVEGHEERVLRGAQELLENPCVIQVESYGETLTLPECYSRIAKIGPDWYFSNIRGLHAADLFERATAMMIESNHEKKTASIHAGDFALSVSGKSYAVVRRIALKFVGSRL